MKPSETNVAGHRRNRETAPLKGAVAGFAVRAARGSVAGRWAARTDSQPNIRRAITSDGRSPSVQLRNAPWISLYYIQKGED
jgi:hypothetical protein